MKVMDDVAKDLQTTLDCDRKSYLQLQEKYRQLEKQFRSTVEMQMDIITLSKPDGTVLYMNRANREFFGKKMEEMEGKSFEILIPEEDRKRSLEVFRSITLEKPIVINIHQVINGKGEIRWIKWINRGIFDERGKIETVLANGQDITDQVIAEQARKKADEEAKELLAKTMELNQIKSNIITLASHELKTPLTAIYGWVKFMESMKRQGKDLDQLVDMEILSSLVRNAERLESIINSYLDVGRIESDHLQLNLTRVNISILLDAAIQTITPLAREKDIEIEISGKPEEVTVDVNRFEQVLTNLLSNAVKYSPEHTKVQAHMEMQENNPVRRRYVISIQDEGFGFTQGELKVATEPFPNIYNLRGEKANVKGTGLGLYISKNIIEKHGGSLSIHSDGPNKGSTVTLTLPA